MTTNKLIFSRECKFELATNIFINVPVILKYEDLNLIEIINEAGIEYTTKIPIFHSDGTHIADAKGNRIYKTPEGKNIGIEIIQEPRLWICELENKPIFEIRQKAPDFFKTTAELFTNDGYFIKYSDNPSPILIAANGEYLKIGGITMSGNVFNGGRVGIHIMKNGSVGIGG